MREILFRGKRIDNGEWFVGFYCEKPPHVDGIDHHYIMAFYFHNDFYDYIPRYFEIDPSTLCQFVGKTDKHGNMIFEGDILEWKYFDCIEKRVVVWNGAGYSAVCDMSFPLKCEQLSELWTNEDEVAVIGNIYDNPELLEDKS